MLCILKENHRKTCIRLKFLSFYLNLIDIISIQATMLLSLIPSILERPCKAQSRQLRPSIVRHPANRQINELANSSLFRHSPSPTQHTTDFRKIPPRRDMTRCFLMVVSFTEYDQALPVCLCLPVSNRHEFCHCCGSILFAMLDRGSSILMGITVAKRRRIV